MFLVTLGNTGLTMNCFFNLDLEIASLDSVDHSFLTSHLDNWVSL